MNHDNLMNKSKHSVGDTMLCTNSKIMQCWLGILSEQIKHNIYHELYMNVKNSNVYRRWILYIWKVYFECKEYHIFMYFIHNGIVGTIVWMGHLALLTWLWVMAAMAAYHLNCLMTAFHLKSQRIAGMASSMLQVKLQNQKLLEFQTISIIVGHMVKLILLSLQHAFSCMMVATLAK